MSFHRLCDDCRNQGCCTNSAVPLVFSQDFADLKSIGKNNDKFLMEFEVSGKPIRAIRKKNNSDICVFWDEDKKICSIYQNRPFDCRAYPFDICMVGGKYHWIVYSCNMESDWQWTEEYLSMLENDKQFVEIMEKIDIFAGHTEMVLPQESKKTPYVVLRKVKYKKL